MILRLDCQELIQTSTGSAPTQPSNFLTLPALPSAMTISSGPSTMSRSPLRPSVALKMLHDVRIGDILLEAVEGRKLRLRLVARPNAEQPEIIAALGLSLPERLCADQDATPREFIPKAR